MNKIAVEGWVTVAFVSAFVVIFVWDDNTKS